MSVLPGLGHHVCMHPAACPSTAQGSCRQSCQARHSGHQCAAARAKVVEVVAQAPALLAWPADAAMTVAAGTIWAALIFAGVRRSLCLVPLPASQCSASSSSGTGNCTVHDLYKPSSALYVANAKGLIHAVCIVFSQHAHAWHQSLTIHCALHCTADDPAAQKHTCSKVSSALVRPYHLWGLSIGNGICICICYPSIY